MATSAFQIEGARGEDGKGQSIWDTFTDLGHVDSRSATACDHYHRLEEDLELLGILGVNAYRFSISWTRILPDGSGRVEPRGLAFYDRLIDGLLERGITPFPTLYHWDLPQTLQDRGGWVNRDTALAFAEYATVVSDRLGDRVGNWITHNEPWVAAYLGHLEGVFAPGLTDWRAATTAAHHILVSHGLAVDVIRRHSPEARVGIALDCRPARPASGRPEDMAAASHFDGFRNRWFFDPVFGRGYPDDIREVFVQGGRLDPKVVHETDMDTIAAPIDFLGLNYYTTLPVAAGAEERDDPEQEPGPDPEPGFTEMGWAIDPAGLSAYLNELNDRYAPGSILVTENGASYGDGPDADGAVHDTRRIDYLAKHVEAVSEARRSGVPVDGYFVWSLLDNLEWTSGFDQRFGLVWVDHDSQVRLPKVSFHWYRQRVSHPI